MKFKFITLLILGIPFSLYAVDYEYIDATKRIGYYTDGEDIKFVGGLGSRKANCNANISKSIEYFDANRGWESSYNDQIQCINIEIYNTQKKNTEEQKKKEEEAKKLQNEIYKNTIAEQNKKKDLEEYNKSIEEAKKVLEQKTQSETKVMPATTEIKKTLSLAGQKKASLLKKRIELLQKQIIQLQTQIDELK